MYTEVNCEALLHSLLYIQHSPTMSTQAHYYTHHTRTLPLHVIQYPFHPMDRRYYDEHGQPLPGSGAPQHSPADVLQWLDSLSGQGQAPDPATGYAYTGQWLSQQAYAQMPPQQQYQYQQYQQQQQQQYQQYMQQQQHQHQHHSQFQQGSSSAPAPGAPGHGQPHPGMGYAAAPGQLEQSYSYEDYDYEGSSHGSHSETESVAARRRIALDPSQPLTVDGKPRARVFVACDRWCVLPFSYVLPHSTYAHDARPSRTRKLRCDGAKPVCYHCQKAGVECRYDPTPKRRGQDKAPRTRSAVGTRKPRRPAVKKDEAGGSQSQQGSTAERR